ncbi:MAG: virulence RhuM family protein, partial [Candidatus Nomurabacteria bacterium]|nr:virulence RhuM family protein [Candidatus Nomurabacteria bacterium]
MKNEIVIYQGKNGEIKFNADVKDETIWASETAIAKLFETTRQNVNLHVNNIIKEGELDERTRKDFLQVQKEGAREVSRSVKMYNLDMILSVGYRIKSKTATNFRIWATKTLKSYIV